MSDKRARMIEALTALMLSLYTPAFAADSVKINDLGRRCIKSPTHNARRPSRRSAHSTISGTPATKSC